MWFQNKRQRERKISRSKGLFSTPGLPDTPAATAAAAAAYAQQHQRAVGQVQLQDPATAATASSGVTSMQPANPGVSTGEMRLHKEQTAKGNAHVNANNAQVLDGRVEASASATSSSVSALQFFPLTQTCAATAAVSAVGTISQTLTPSGNHDEQLATAPRQGKLTELFQPSLEGRTPLLSGVPMSRSVSQPPPQNRAVTPMPTSLDDAHIPLGLNNCNDQALNDSRGDSETLSGLLVQRSNSSGSQRSGHSACNGSFSDLRPLSMPWFHPSLQGSLPSAAQQAEMHCRAAVAAAAAAIAGGTSPSDMLGPHNILGDLRLPNGLPMLSSLLGTAPRMPAQAAADLSANTADLTASLAATLNAGQLNTMLDVGVDDLPEDIQQELLNDSQVRLPQVEETPSTSQALGVSVAQRCKGGMEISSTGPGRSAGSSAHLTPGSNGGHNAFKKQRFKPLPLVHSGVSGLLDDMSIVASVAPAEAMPPLPSQAGIVGDSSKAFLTHGFGAQSLTAAEASDMQAAADSYVQVIASREEPFQIVWASRAWLELYEFESSEQVLGRTLDIIQGPLTSRDAVGQLMEAIRKAQPVTLTMVNHTRSGTPFSQTLRVEPLRDSQGFVQCFQATSSSIEMLQPVGLSEAAKSVTDSALSALCSSPGRGMARISSELQINEMLDLFDQQADIMSIRSTSTLKELPPSLFFVLCLPSKPRFLYPPPCRMRSRVAAPAGL